MDKPGGGDVEQITIVREHERIAVPIRRLDLHLKGDVLDGCRVRNRRKFGCAVRAGDDDFRGFHGVGDLAQGGVPEELNAIEGKGSRPCGKRPEANLSYGSGAAHAARLAQPGRAEIDQPTRVVHVGQKRSLRAIVLKKCAFL